MTAPRAGGAWLRIRRAVIARKNKAVGIWSLNVSVRSEARRLLPPGRDALRRRDGLNQLARVFQFFWRDNPHLAVACWGAAKGVCIVMENRLVGQAMTIAHDNICVAHVRASKGAPPTSKAGRCFV